MARTIAQKIRTFDRKVLSQLVPWHVNSWSRQGH